MENQDTICSPIINLEELDKFKVPTWVSSISSLQQKHNWCISTKDIRCHEDVEKWKVKSRYLHNTVPRTLVCHDMKGGYLEDKYVYGSTDETSYNFIHWMVIDTFVYFSHSFITIPPLGWINAAHRHGVNILGTIITEGKSGEQCLNAILENDDKINKFVSSILKITEAFKLDGWLLNIENIVSNIVGLKKLVKQLSYEMHNQNPNALLIWYDSVLETGELKWQNKLNEKNSCWFDLCDGLFLNYNWTEKHLLDTFNNCGSRTLDIYVGIDVFARNCLGGMESYKSMQLIRQHDFSVAIFAPGWTHETLAVTPEDTFRKRFEINDLKFWKSLSPYLYEHGVKNLFTTTFHNGCSKNYYNMNSLDFQINSLRLGVDGVNNVNNETVGEVENNVKDGSDCSCQTMMNSNGTGLKICYQKSNQINRILACDIVCENTILVAVIYQFVQQPISFNILLMCQDPNGKLSKIELNPQDYGEINDTKCVLTQYERLILLRRIFRLPTPLDSKWILKSFKIKNKNLRILELGIQMNEPGEILFGGLTIHNHIRGM